MQGFGRWVVNELYAEAKAVALSELQHEIGGEVVDEEILVGAVLLAHVLETEGVLVVGDEVPLAVKLEKVVLGPQLVVYQIFRSS